MKDLSYTPFIVLFILFGCNKKFENKQGGKSKDYQWGAYYDDYFPDKRDSAFFLLNRVVNNSNDSIEKADAYFRMGRIQLFAGDYQSAQASFLSGIKTSDQSDTAHYDYLAANYNGLANASFELKEYDSAIANYRLASTFATSYDQKLYLFNNLGVTYQKQGDYKRAASILDSAANNITRDTSIKGKIISNFARTKWLADPAYNPISEFRHALTLLFLIRDYSSITSTFGHLSDYYEKTRPDSASFYALKRLEVAKNLDDPSDRLAALNQLIRVGPPNQTKQFAEEYLELNDSITKAQSKDRNQYALIRFDAEKSKADNLLLQKHIGNQRLIIWGTSLLGILAIIAILVRARIRRIKFRQESENAIRASQLKISQKVHDVVANELYGIMNEMEHGKTIEWDELITRIEALYEKSRNISYEEVSTADHLNYDSQIHELFNNFATEQTEVYVVGNQPTFWSRITGFQKNELLLVLKELLVNMKKHSGAKNVSVVFRQEYNRAFIVYKDDGTGFPVAVEFGNGLRNTVNRIHSLKGEIIFDKNEKEGVSVMISFPLQS